MAESGRKSSPTEPLFSAPPSNTEFVGRFIGQQRNLWLNQIEHSALYANCSIVVEQIGDGWYPMPKTLPDAVHDGKLRCNFANIAEEVLEKCPWFWKEVVCRKVPSLAEKEYREGCIRLVNLEKEKEELKMDLEVFEPELPELQAKCSSLAIEFQREKNETALLCGEKENALKEAKDIRESLLGQNDALKKEIDSLTVRLHSHQ